MKKEKNYWNPNFAYGVGLITTDGCLSSDRRHIEFTSKDLDLVESFKKCLNLKNKIGKKARGGSTIKCYHRIQFGNVKLYGFLLSIGLSANKSKKLAYVRIPDNFFADFLRGVIDGDGCIDYFIHPESKERQYRIRLASASRNFLEWLKQKLTNLLEVNGSIKSASRAYQLNYCKGDSCKIANFIYYDKNIPALERKYRKAKLMITREW